MTDTSQALLERHLKQLKLPGMRRAYAKLAGECARQGEDVQRFLLRVVEAGMLDRERRATGRPRLRPAGAESGTLHPVARLRP